MDAPKDNPLMPHAGMTVRETSPRALAALCLALAVITFAVFGQTLRHQFVNFDDDDYVVKNPFVTQGLTLPGLIWAFTHSHAANWHPLTWLSHMLDCDLYGLDPGGHHLTNVLVHTGAVIALFLVLRRITGAMWRSAFVAAVFAIHPLRAESVAWVSERKDVLSGLFFMLTVGAYAHYASGPKSWRRLAPVAGLFAAGLLCKPMLVTLPLVLLLLDYWPLQRTEPPAKLLAEKMPLFALSALSCLATILAQHRAIRSFESLPVSDRLIAAVLSCKVYLVQMFYPVGLAAFYPFPPHLSRVQALGAALLLGVICALVWSERRRRPWLLIGWGWYLVMLLPVAGIVQVGAQAHADRYTYLPQIGVYVALTWLAADWAAQWPVPRPVQVGLMAGVILVLMICAWRQAAYWKNSETLWRHALACTTNNLVATLDLGHVLYESGRFDETIALYQQALETGPDNAEFQSNLGNALRQKGRWDEAIEHYRRAVQINPSFMEAQFNLGKALSLRGSLDEAIPHFQATLQLDPGFIPARASLGNALLQQGRADQAVAELQQVADARPDDAGSHLNLAVCCLQLNRMETAKTHYERALELNPNDPGTLNNFAWFLAACPEASFRDGNRAVDLAEQADTRSGGENPIILHTLAAALAQAGRFADAVAAAERATQIAETQSNRDLTAQLQSDLALYRARKPIPAAKQSP